MPVVPERSVPVVPERTAAGAAKGVCLSSPERAPQLAALLAGGRRGASPVAVLAAVEAVAAVACDPGARSTEGLMLVSVLTEAAAVGRPLFALFDHPAGACPQHTQETAQVNWLQGCTENHEFMKPGLLTSSDKAQSSSTKQTF